jgi:hypothetical protein
VAATAAAIAEVLQPRKGRHILVHHSGMYYDTKKEKVP